MRPQHPAHLRASSDGNFKYRKKLDDKNALIKIINI